MGMSKAKSELLLLAALLILASQARPLSSSNSNHRNASVYGTLGVVCKCCEGGECKSTWTNSCPKIHCLPWRTRYQ